MYRRSFPLATRLAWSAILTMCLSLSITTAKAQEGRQTFRHDGLERTYFITVPNEVYAEPGGVPLVVVLHGAGGNAPNVMNMTGFDELAMDEGFIALFPEGTTRDVFVGDNLFLTWNASHCCGYGMNGSADDVGFLRRLINEIVATYPVDPSRIFVSGMSNGGMMAHRIAIEMSDQIAAIGTVVGAMFGDELLPPSPVSAVIVNGAEDELIPVAGGDIGVGGLFRNAWDGTPLAPSEFQATFWALANRCIDKPAAVETKPAYTLSRYLCPPGVAVEYYVVEDNGHAWPGHTARQATDAFDATEVIWEFFQNQPLVAPLPDVEVLPLPEVSPSPEVAPLPELDLPAPSAP